jgi:hypothetical protein
MRCLTSWMRLRIRRDFPHFMNTESNSVVSVITQGRTLLCQGKHRIKFHCLMLKQGRNLLCKWLNINSGMPMVSQSQTTLYQWYGRAILLCQLYPKVQLCCISCTTESNYAVSTIQLQVKLYNVNDTREFKYAVINETTESNSAVAVMPQSRNL